MKGEKMTVNSDTAVLTPRDVSSWLDQNAPPGTAFWIVALERGGNTLVQNILELIDRDFLSADDATRARLHVFGKKDKSLESVMVWANRSTGNVEVREAIGVSIAFGTRELSLTGPP